MLQVVGAKREIGRPFNLCWSLHEMQLENGVGVGMAGGFRFHIEESGLCWFCLESN